MSFFDPKQPYLLERAEAEDDEDYEDLGEEERESGGGKRNLLLACADRGADFVFNAFEWFLDRRFGPIEEMNFYKGPIHREGT